MDTPPSAPEPSAEQTRRRRRRRGCAEAQKRFRDRGNTNESKAAHAAVHSASLSYLPPIYDLYRLRRATAKSEEAARLAAERRCRVDADYRENCRRELSISLAGRLRYNLLTARKFIAKFGRDAYMKYYLPLYETHGPHLPGIKWVWEDEDGV
ncbi:hypothetical protein GGX14DRAFT_573163 [Mycena pura]|uniref:Uncharacterized protein n=1 Tax=Mycena pura TaxID=153505 RepID=A0AAD6YA37_9AGAR|nr:hypothetical protein GGX14DRAFT_573163 [Mycena pura]